MIGNVDNHAKNHALLHVTDRCSPAPAYDLLATRLNPDLTDELSFRWGEARTLDELTRGDVMHFAEALGLRGQGRERAMANAARKVCGNRW